MSTLRSEMRQLLQSNGLWSDEADEVLDEVEKSLSTLDWCGDNQPAEVISAVACFVKISAADWLEQFRPNHPSIQILKGTCHG